MSKYSESWRNSRWQRGIQMSKNETSRTVLCRMTAIQTCRKRSISWSISSRICTEPSFSRNVSTSTRYLRCIQLYTHQQQQQTSEARIEIKKMRPTPVIKTVADLAEDWEVPTKEVTISRTPVPPTATCIIQTVTILIKIKVFSSVKECRTLKSGKNWMEHPTHQR